MSGINEAVAKNANERGLVDDMMMVTYFCYLVTAVKSRRFLPEFGEHDK